MRHRGFTLIEALVVMLIMAFALMALVSIFISHARSYRTQNSELEVTNEARVALDDVDNYVRQATRVVATYTTYSSSATQVILQIQSINSSNALIGGKFDYVVYVYSNSVLQRQIFPDASSSRPASTKQLGSHITSLTFTYDNANFPSVTEVDTNLTVSESAGYQTRSVNYDSKSKLRNY
jgi:prepilin-type N-terminal cleavage/methylation domain-containing protein